MNRSLSTLLLVSIAAAPLAAQDIDPAKVTIKTTPIGSSIAMVEGAGGNIGLLKGPDGVFVIDDQYAPLAPKLKEAIAAFAPGEPLRFLANTHWHGDHTGGNEAFAKEPGMLVVAHENVRKRMSTKQFIALLKSDVPPSPAAALPVITFTDTVSFYFDGDTVDVVHVAPAHTDGDAIIRFRHANVIHAGDTFFNGIYPFIDRSSGGTVDGVIAATERMLAVSDAETKIIPGHGPLADKAALQAYHDMLVGVRAAVARAMRGGKSLGEVMKAAPTKPWDAQWGKGFMNPETFTSIVYDDLKAKSAKPAKKA